MAIIAENLPNLKVLILKTIRVGSAPHRNGGQNELEIRLSLKLLNVTIHQTCYFFFQFYGAEVTLEYLELSFKAMKAKDAVAELKKLLPGLRGVMREVQVLGCFKYNITKIIKF